jgi:DNA cross-link repair 1A protein
MTANWSHGPIYCSSITASLVLQQIKVNPEYVVKLPMYQTVNIEGVDVTLLDANQYSRWEVVDYSCPGSALFLFEKKLGKRTFRILHCGDFRASPAHISHPTIRGKFLDVVYLDTTYLKSTFLRSANNSPKYGFPFQEDVITACAQKCQLLADEDISPAEEGTLGAMANWVKAPFTSEKPRGRLLVVVGTYSIGKERIVLGIAKALRTTIYATSGKRRICACLEDDELMGLLTDDPKEAQVHMTR